jgi:hypothetical protein
MWTRLRDSIVTPKNIIDFRNDSFIRVFFYLLIFVLLLSTTTLIYTIQFTGFNSNVIDAYKESFVEIDDNCMLTTTDLVCDENKNHLLMEDELMSVYLDSRDDLVMQDYDGLYNFVFSNDKVYVIFSNTLIADYKISEFIIKDVDFSLQSTDSDQFYLDVFENVDHIAVMYKGYWGVALMMTDLLSNLLLFMLFILISAWFLKSRFKIVPFKQLFKMTVYSSTLLYIIMIFNTMFRLSIFIVILLIVIAVRQNSQLSMEILKRIDKKS